MQNQDKGRDNSPIEVRVKYKGQYYSFCHFTIHLYDAIFHTRPYSTLRSSNHFLNKFNTGAYSSLLSKFSSSADANQADIALSSNDILSLLHISVSINGILLSDEEDDLRSLAKETFLGIPDNWVDSYRKNSTAFFNAFKDKNKNNPTFQALLDKLFG